MRVCKHGCEVKMFCCVCGNHTSMNLKTVLSYFIYPFPLGLKLSLLSEENLYFGKHFFGKTRTHYVYKTSATTLCGW